MGYRYIQIDRNTENLIDQQIGRKIGRYRNKQKKRHVENKIWIDWERKKE